MRPAPRNPVATSAGCGPACCRDRPGTCPRHIGDAPDGLARHGQDQPAAADPHELGERRRRLGHVLQHLDHHHEVERLRRERQRGDVGVDTREVARPPAGGEHLVVQVDANDLRVGIERAQPGAHLALTHPHLQHRLGLLARKRVAERGEEALHQPALDGVPRSVLVVGVARQHRRGHVVAPVLARCGPWPPTQQRLAASDWGPKPPRPATVTTCPRPTAPILGLARRFHLPVAPRSRARHLRDGTTVDPAPQAPPIDSVRVTDPNDLATRLVQGDRRALARSITLVESTRRDHRAAAAALLDAVVVHTGAAIRLGITGTPGAGKSTFIEELGSHLTAAGHRVAVLAVDPSSRRSGGSILGDKTRMERLARDPNAFIRPSPSGGSLGGIARRTREAVLVCEAAGFDVILVETVGVGQSEVAVADMVDCFCLIAAPGGGDELQGIKRGIIELADIVVVNKADGDLLPAARRAMADYRQAVHLLRPKHAGWEVPVLATSALQGTGVDEVWTAVEKLVAHLREDGALDRLRAGQAVAWMWDEIRESLIDSFRQDPRVAESWSDAEEAVRAGRLSPTTAAHRLLEAHRDPLDQDGTRGT